MRQLRRGKSTRVQAAAIAACLAFAGSILAKIVDLATARHGICAEHQQALHLPDSAHPAPSASPGGAKDRRVELGRRLTHDHDCLLATALEIVAFAVPPPEATAAGVDQVVGPPCVAAPVTKRLFQLAPKASPPARPMRVLAAHATGAA